MPTLISKFQVLKKKEENKELVKHSFVSLLVRIGGAAAAFFMNVVAARYLGAEQAGYFFLAVTVSTLIATIGRVGADQTILRFVSVYGEQKQWNKVHAAIRKIISWSSFLLIGLTTLICIFSKQISVYLFHKPDLQWPLFWCMLSIPFFAIYNVHGMALQGRRKVLLSVTSLKILTPLFLMLMMVSFTPRDGGTASIYYLVACFLNLIIAHYWWRRNIPPATVKEDFNSAELWKSCGPLWIVAIMNVITTWGGQFIAGIFNTPQELAQLAVARNTTMLVSFILTAVNNVSAPRFAIM